MSAGLVILIVIAIAIAGYFLGRARALSNAGGDIRELHSLPGYYGQTVFLFTTAPALLVCLAWLLLQPLYVETRVAALITPADIAEGSSLSLVMADVRRIALVTRRHAESREEGRSALVFTAEVGYGLGRMFETLQEVRRSPVQYRVFRSRAAGIAWIEGRESD